MTRRIRGEAHACNGGCGTMLRPDRGTIKEFPGTVRRRTGGYCWNCRKAAETVIDDRPLVRPCTGCGHMTRPTRVKPQDAPGARLRAGDLCRVCDNNCGTVPPERAALVAHELEVFFRARRRRGVPAEGIKVGV